MIRPYQYNDWPEVSAIYDLAKPDEMKGLVDPGQIIPIEDDERMLAYFQDSEIWVYEDMGTVLGFIGRKTNVVSWLFVHPRHRRKGIARTLLRHLMEIHEGVLQLNLTRRNKPAMELYKSLGFEMYDEFEGNMYGHPIPAVRMRIRSEPEPDRAS